MTQPSRIVRFAVLAFGILFFDSSALAQQSQSWKFPVSIPTTQSGYPSPVVASTGTLAVGTYSITAKTSLQNLYSQREPSGKCFLVLLDANGNVISGSQLDETDVTLDETSNGADTASITLSTVYVVTAGGPNNVGVHCMASQKSQFTNTVITATSLQGPPGPQGAAGAAATVQVGTTMTVSAASPASVLNSGTPNAAVLNFLIPQGPTGPAGPTGAQGPAGLSGVLSYYNTQGPSTTTYLADGHPCNNLPGPQCTTVLSTSPLSNAGTYLLWAQVTVANTINDFIVPSCILEDTGAFIGSTQFSATGYAPAYPGGFPETFGYPNATAVITLSGWVTTSSPNDQVLLQCNYLDPSVFLGGASQTAVFVDTSKGSITAVQVQ